MEIFKQDKKNKQNVEIGTDFFDSYPWSCYFEGYREAATSLSKLVIEKLDSGEFVNRNIYIPIFYLYRHFLELAFKEICINCDRQLKTNNNYNYHDLKTLFQNFKDKVERIYKEPYLKNRLMGKPFSDNELKEIEDIVNQFDNFDKGSYSFRYPSTKGGDPVWPKSIKVDFRKFTDNIKRIEIVLSKISVDTMIKN